MDLISVIVPIYNVEKYLNQCIDSLINQTYKNLEIILVDDGSTDNSPMVCDKYAKEDERIRVIHCKNGGVSAARNCGLDMTTGEFIFFLDSDDYLDADAIESLYEKMVSNDADIAIGSLNFTYKSFSELINEEKWDVVVTPEIAFKEAMEMKKVLPCPHGKIYKREIFEKVRYPKGILYEDAYIIGDAFLQAKKIYLTSDAKLHYRIRRGSIMHSEFNSKTMDLIYAYRHCLDIAENNFLAVEVCEWRYLWIFLLFWTALLWAAAGTYLNFMRL